MKSEKLIYCLTSLVVITGTTLKIFHFPFGNPIVIGGLISVFVFQSFLITRLKKRIETLEKNKF